MSEPSGPAAPAFDERSPLGEAAPVVFDSPHSGFAWPEDFRPSASEAAIRTTWDAHVDELLAEAPGAGITLLTARAPRAYVDLNRDVTDLDPALLAGPWPTPLAPTDYSRRGMGLVRRLALPDVPMYDAPLAPAAVRTRIDRWYRPYRERLGELVRGIHARQGLVWHLNWHSMKSAGNAMNVDAGARRPDLVISDRRGQTANPALTARIAEWFAARGRRVQVNDPYQGGDLVRTFGDPRRGVHSVQVELNRALYMDEATTAPHEGFAPLRAELLEFGATLAAWAREASRGR